MIRPLPAPGRAADGGDHALEADVMRFVAILALCLVAISTLVDELPAPAAATAAAQRPVVPDVPMVPASPASPPASASARAGDAVPITPTREAVEPAPAKRPAPRPSATAAVWPRPDAEAGAREPPPRMAESAAGRRAATPPASADPPVSPDRRGFTLRFASDEALLRLVARGEAAVFVFDGADTLGLGLDGRGPSFARAPGPSRFHAIAGETVPPALRRALAAAGRRADAVVWGVTLPAATSAALARLMRTHESGELVIDEDGRVRLEDRDG